MKPKTMIMMAAAIVCGLGAAYVSSRLIQEKKVTATVWVAADSIKPETLIREPEKMFVPKEKLQNELRAKCFLATPEALAALKGRAFLKSLEKDVEVTEDDLLDRKATDVEVLLPKGSVGIAIKISPEMFAGGFALQGTHVDVIHHGREDSKVILENILVVAIDQTPTRSDKPGMLGGTATLQVTKKQALLLSKAKISGSLELVLKSFDDRTEEGDVVSPEPPPLPKTQEPTLVADNGSLPRTVEKKASMQILNKGGWETWESPLNEFGAPTRWKRTDPSPTLEEPAAKPPTPAAPSAGTPDKPAAPDRSGNPATRN